MLAFVRIFIHLRPAFSRVLTFYRALIVVLAMSLKPDKEGGVTPLVHALPFINPGTAYGRLLGFLGLLPLLWIFESSGLSSDHLA